MKTPSLLVGFVAVTAAALMSPAAAQKRKYPWEKEPGPIAGKWKATCPASGNLQIEFRLVGDKTVAAGGMSTFTWPAATPAYLGVGYIIGPELGALSCRRWMPCAAH